MNRILDDFYEQADLLPSPGMSEVFPYWDFIWDNLMQAEDFMRTNGGFYVYTLVETDDERQWIVDGASHVNRLGYLFARRYVPLEDPILFFDRRRDDI